MAACLVVGGWARFLGCLPREPRALWGAGLGQAADLKCQIYCRLLRCAFSKVRLARCVGQPERGMLVPARATNYPPDHPLRMGLCLRLSFRLASEANE